MAWCGLIGLVKVRITLSDLLLYNIPRFSTILGSNSFEWVGHYEEMKPSGACVIKQITAVIYLDAKVKP